MFAHNTQEIAKQNTYFRKVLQTGKHAQVVAMSLHPGEDIGMETHANVDQILYFIHGNCEATINGQTRNVQEHDIVFVPAGAEHNFKNTGSDDLKLFTVYAPPQHADGTIHITKADAQKAEEHE